MLLCLPTGGTASSPRWGGGYPIQSWMGVPWVSYPHPDLGPDIDGGRVPLHQLDEVPPHPDLCWRYLLIHSCDGVPPLSAGWGTTPVGQMGVPPKVGQTHTCENITSCHPLRSIHTESERVSLGRIILSFNSDIQTKLEPRSS